jgi:hypothetical protein
MKSFLKELFLFYLTWNKTFEKELKRQKNVTPVIIFLGLFCTLKDTFLKKIFLPSLCLLVRKV